MAHAHVFYDWSLFTFVEPFSGLLWAALFVTLFAMILAVVLFEWISPIGKNPRYLDQAHIFSLGSSFWTCTSMLFRQLCTFQTPHSCTNKILIHVWGFFCVIFWATYLAQLAAFYTSYLPTYEINDFNDGILMPMRTGVVKSSSSEGYLRTENVMLWHHIENFKVNSIEEGVDKVKKGKLDILIADTAILDYYRANDEKCGLRILGQPIFDDTYAVGMPKEFPLRDALSDLFMEYSNYGFVDQLKKKWFREAPCASRTRKPTALTFLSVSGLYLFLVVGFFLSLLGVLVERMIFSSLPEKKKEEGCFWKSSVGMFFSQKVYRYVNGIDSTTFYTREYDSDEETHELTKAMTTVSILLLPCATDCLTVCSLDYDSRWIPCHLQASDADRRSSL